MTIAKVIYFANSILTMLLIHFAYSQVFTTRCKRRWVILAYTMYFIISSLQFLELGDKWLNLILNPIVIISLSVLYTGSRSSRLVFGALVYICNLLADGIAYIGVDRLYRGYNSNAEMPGEFIRSVPRSATTVLTLFLLFLLVRIFKYLLGKKVQYVKSEIPRAYTAAAFAILSLLIGLDGLVINLSLKLEPIFHIQIMLVQLMIALLSVLVIYLYNTSLEYIYEKAKNEYLGEQLHRWALWYNRMLSSQKTLVHIGHNAKCTLCGVLGMLRSNKVEDAVELLSKKLGEIDQVKHVSVSGNIAVDTIINAYERDARNILGIGLDTDISIPEDMNPDPYLLSMILGNALQNSIEACENVDKDRRYIKIKSKIREKRTRTLHISIENPYVQEPILDGEGKLVTSKMDAENHGIGLSSMQDVLTEGQGTVAYVFKNGVFELGIFLYNL